APANWSNRRRVSRRIGSSMAFSGPRGGTPRRAFPTTLLWRERPPWRSVLSIHIQELVAAQERLAEALPRRRLRLRFRAPPGGGLRLVFLEERRRIGTFVALRFTPQRQAIPQRDALGVTQLRVEQAAAESKGLLAH